MTVEARTGALNPSCDLKSKICANLFPKLVCPFYFFALSIRPLSTMSLTSRMRVGTW